MYICEHVAYAAMLCSTFVHIEDDIRSNNNSNSSRSSSNRIVVGVMMMMIIIIMLGFIFADTMTFEEFVDVCRKEPPTSEDDLMKAFRKIDINGDGYISLDELYKVMTTVKFASCSFQLVIG